MRHIPVLLSEVIETLNPQNGSLYVDGTFGAGGYTRAILEKAPTCRVIALDQDDTAIAGGQDLVKEMNGRLILKQGNFEDMDTLVGEPVDGIVLDLGVSSMQIDTPERGFSFQKDGPLDMRMSSVGITAADIVNTFKEKDLADIFFEFGEEKASRRIAAKIVEQRKEKPFETTLELAKAIHSVMPFKPGQCDTATRTFQALRIFVNNEMGVLDTVLMKAPALLKKDGRFVVVSFHSLEDRRVKNAFNTLSGNVPSANRYVPPVPKQETHFELLTKKAIQPTETEISENPRSRSSRLRAVRRFS